MSFNPQFARIGEVLVHEKLVSDDQIKEALIKQSNFGLKIGETLIKLGYLTEKELLIVGERAYGIDTNHFRIGLGRLDFAKTLSVFEELVTEMEKTL